MTLYSYLYPNEIYYICTNIDKNIHKQYNIYYKIILLKNIYFESQRYLQIIIEVALVVLTTLGTIARIILYRNYLLQSKMKQLGPFLYITPQFKVTLVALTMCHTLPLPDPRSFLKFTLLFQ